MSINDWSYNQAKMAGYMIVDRDEDSDPRYIGFMDQYGHWYILEENQAQGTFRYVKGADDYTTAWTDRASLTYDYPVIFNR